jgi:hypothetical protein
MGVEKFIKRTESLVTTNKNGLRVFALTSVLLTGCDFKPYTVEEQRAMVEQVDREWRERFQYETKFLGGGGDPYCFYWGSRFAPQVAIDAVAQCRVRKAVQDE